MCDRTASDVFLTLWRYHATHAEATDSGDFLMCAETWEKIRKMETQTQPIILPEPFAVDREAVKTAIESVAKRMESTCTFGEKSTPSDVEKVHADTPESAPDSVVQNGPQKKHPWDTYRTNCQSRLLITQFSTEQIVRAGGGAFTTDDVRAFADDMRAIRTPVIAAIMSAMDKLEGKE